MCLWLSTSRYLDSLPCIQVTINLKVAKLENKGWSHNLSPSFWWLLRKYNLPSGTVPELWLGEKCLVHRKINQSNIFEKQRLKDTLKHWIIWEDNTFQWQPWVKEKIIMWTTERKKVGHTMLIRCSELASRELQKYHRKWCCPSLRSINQTTSPVGNQTFKGHFPFKPQQR